MRAPHRALRLALALVLPTLVATSCGNDSLAPGFGAGCSAGVLQAGDTLTGAFTTSSCFLDQDFYSGDRVPYQGYTVHLTKGKGYLVYLRAVPDTANGNEDNVDARLTLWTRSASGNPIPLALSDDEADGRNSEIWFVSPVDGTFSLVASSYDFDELGGYQLSMNECPVLGGLDTAGTYQFSLPASACRLHEAGGHSSDTSAVAFVTLNAQPGENVKTTVTTANFPPVWSQGGPGFDTWSNIYQESNYATARGSGSTASFTMGEVGGPLTVAVGATTVDSVGGAFSITLQRTPPAAPPVGARPWSVAGLLSSGMRPHPAKTR